MQANILWAHHHLFEAVRTIIKIQYDYRDITSLSAPYDYWEVWISVALQCPQNTGCHGLGESIVGGQESIGRIFIFDS